MGRRGFVRGCGGLVLAATGSGSCKGTRGPRYPGAAPPKREELARAAAPPVSAVAIPAARLRFRGHRGTLSYLAQAPSRFRATVTVAGQELLSVALSEAGYQIVDKLGEPPGFYHGEDGRCAVAFLTGATLSPEAFVAAMRGGAPIPEQARARLEPRGYDPEVGAERADVLVRGMRVILWFRPVAHLDFAWRLARAEVSSHDRPIAVTYDGWKPVGSAAFPHRVRIETGRRRLVVTVHGVELEPSWARAAAAPSSGGNAAPDGGRGAGRAQASEEGWDDGAPWEEGGTWENADGPEGPVATGRTSTPPGRQGPSPEAKPQDGSHDGLRKPQAAGAVPKRFRLERPAGLADRGALCR